MNRITIPCNKNNYRSNKTRSLSSIKYLVIHYTANNGDTAKNNGDYFTRNLRIDENGKPKSPSSAHYFIDETTICQSVPDNYDAYHCETPTKKYYSQCRNTNSIGIEMVSRKDSNGQYYIKDEVVKNTISFVKELMAKYNISPENVIRHYDVTHKLCPEPFVRTPKLWDNFKKELEEEEVEIQDTNIKTPSGIKKISCINYNGTNFAKLRDLSTIAPVEISFANNTVVANPAIEEKSIKIDSEKQKVKSINLFDSNYVNLRDISGLLGYDVDFNSSTGEISLKKK